MTSYSIRYGGRRGKKITLNLSNDLLVTRTDGPRPLDSAVRSNQAIEAIGACDTVFDLPDAGVCVHRLRSRSKLKTQNDRTRGVLKKEKGLRFAGRVLIDRKSKQPVLYTENIFVKFDDEASSRKCKTVLKQHSLKIKRELPYSGNAYFVEAKEGTGLDVFKIAESLLQNELVELCHPELIREVRRRVAFDEQWHLKKTTINGSVVDQHSNVEAAWPLSEGDGVTIAIIDTGIDVDHEEFATAGKIVAPRDVTNKTNDARPIFSSENHGTACAGVACGNGLHGASGVAPRARLMPIRLMSGLGSQDEADAFVWCADHGASVISCSWGPPDGDWFDPNDPAHNQVFALPDSTRLAIEHAINNGRGGKGCVICWAAGNGNEPVDNDGYASFDKVISVAACSDRGKRSVYSDVGNANWCAFPSNNFGSPTPLTPGIWTADRIGTAGYNPNSGGGDAAGNYTDSFGGTSSACPGAAGVAALILARNPNLRWDEVKDVFKRSADKIDTAGGNYDANDHSPLYGYGRLNAKKAVELATPAAAKYTTIHTAVQSVAIEDLKKSKIVVHVADTKPIKNATIVVAIQHPWRGDLIVHAIPPANTGVGPIMLHNRTGGKADNIDRNYNATTTPALAQLVGKSPAGVWTLEVEDKAKQDTGKMLRFGVELDL